MEHNANFAARASAHVADMDWVPSPMAGVDRKMLDRVGAEVARATSIVRYAPNSSFSPHVHTGGEEFLVLEGVFSDEHGDFGAGSYIRNPPTSSHTPRSAPGCVIFVKLWQFNLDDRTQLTVDTAAREFVPAEGRAGVEVQNLFADSTEVVRLERWSPGTAVELAAPDGLEILCLAGGFRESGQAFTGHDWLRLPPGGTLNASVGASGARVWLKLGNLVDARQRFDRAFAQATR